MGVLASTIYPHGCFDYPQGYLQYSVGYPPDPFREAINDSPFQGNRRYSACS